MLRDNLVGLIEPMFNCVTARESTLSRCALPGNRHRTIDPHAFKIPAPKGAESTLTDNALLHFTLSQDIRTVQLWLGHSDIESTMRYLKPSRSQQTREKVNAICAD